MFTRRKFLNYSSAGAALYGAAGLLPAWAQSASAGNLGLPTLTGSEFDLHVSEFPVTIDGKRGIATCVNGTVPGPLLRFREGDDISIRVHNMLDVVLACAAERGTPYAWVVGLLHSVNRE